MSSFPFFSEMKIINESRITVPNKIATQGVLWQASSGYFLLDIPGVARYMVVEGKTVYIERAPGADETMVLDFLYTTPFAALQYQSGALVFHAAAVTDGHTTILLAGDSGIGKSTLLTALLARGCKMLSDDLSIVKTDENNIVFVSPASEDIYLWLDSYSKFDASIASRQTHVNRRLKVSCPSKMELLPKRLSSIFWMGVHSEGSCKVEEINGALRFQTLGRLLYNCNIANALINKTDYMHTMATLCQLIPLYRLFRPKSVWSTDELADVIFNHLSRQAI